jgi:hypothetical protein
MRNRGHVNGEETSQRSEVMKWVPSVPSNDVAARSGPGADRRSDLGWAGAADGRRRERLLWGMGRRRC